MDPMRLVQDRPVVAVVIAAVVGVVLLWFLVELAGIVVSATFAILKLLVVAAVIAGVCYGGFSVYKKMM